MELSLSGSQINLTTRGKTSPPIVQYPSASRRRPESASHFGAFASNRTALRQDAIHLNGATRRPPQRPMSADHRQPFVSNQLRSKSVKYRECKESSCLHDSSSNILNDLLTEPIQRSSSSWRFSAHKTRRESEHSLGQLIQKKANANMAPTVDERYDVEDDEQEETSIEEEIEDSMSAEEKNNNDGLSTLPHETNFNVNQTKLKIRPLSTSSNTNGENTNKKYVTFSKQPIVVQTTKNASNGLMGQKPDLPGRVSFSKPDVYEEDLSDDDKDVKIKPSAERTINYSSNENNEPSNHATLNISKDIEMDQEEPRSCCTLNCNSMLNVAAQHPKDNHDNDKNLDSLYKNEESDRIISDYRHEIAKINHKHDQDLASIHNYPIKSTEDVSTERLANKDTVISKIISTAWNNHQSMLKHTENKSYEKQSIFESPKLDNEERESVSNMHKEDELKSASNEDTTSIVIDNYLKTSNQKPCVTITPVTKQSLLTPSKCSPQTRHTKLLDPIKSQFTPPSKRNCSSASKTRPTTDEQRLSGFQMEKVESWMSIHEFGDLNDKPINDKDRQDMSYNQSWRDTPTSKTDDEGMFSFDDPIEADESTYDDLVSVIKEIDEQKDLDLDAIAITKVADASGFGKPSETDAETTSPDKMREILSYLDQVETSCEQTIHDTYSGKIPDSFRSEIEFTVEPDIIGDMPKMADLLMLPNQQLARRIIALSLRANELAQAMHLSRAHMASVRTDKSKSVRAEKQTAAVRLADQKRHFESVVQRHQGFIEQLLKDKHLLGEKVAAMTRRIDSQNQAWQHKLETETARVKETAMAAEKIRRERWVRENTKKIKELTVKGLEQEINAMTIGHQKDMTDVKRLHQQELLAAVEEAHRKHEQVEFSIRETYAQDREASIEKERHAIRERYERQIESEQQTFDEQRAKLIADFAAEKKRWQLAAQEKEMDFERRKIELVEERKDEIYYLRSEHSERMGMIEAKNQHQLKTLQDQFESDFAIWKLEHESAASLRQSERENVIRQECRTERDRQIDAIVAKVDAEALENQKAFDAKISRLQTSFEANMKEVELSERSYREKYAEIRNKLAESEASRENVQASAKQLELQHQYSKKLYGDLLAERDTLKATTRREIESELVALRKDRDAEIERIYGRVQVAIEKKDGAIEVLHKDNDALKERCIKLEAVVRQQRQDYFAK